MAAVHVLRNKQLSTNCIAVEKENSMRQAILLLYYVEWVGAIEVSISLQRNTASTFTTGTHNRKEVRERESLI